MEYKKIVEGKNLQKCFKNFTLSLPEFEIPEGFATALIGENGAGKTTLLNMLSGLRLDYKGMFSYFGKPLCNEPSCEDKLNIAYTGTDNFFLPHWTVAQIRDICNLLYSNFDDEKFMRLYDELAISQGNGFDKNKKVSSLSDGTKMKLTLATAFARDSKLMIMDEPASPLDPLMRDKLCEMIHNYINEREGNTVFFSTHNISDMENVTDYAIIMERGLIVEKGFVEDLKEKYILVKGEAKDFDEAKKVLYTISGNKYGFEGICLADDLDKLAGMDITTETASLFQISVAVMKKNTLVK